MKTHLALDDLSRHLQHQIGQVFERQIGVAKHVLEPVDLTLMMMQAAVSVCLTTAATAAASLDDTAGPDEIGSFFDLTLKAISDLAQTDRERSIGAIIARRATGAAA